MSQSQPPKYDATPQNAISNNIEEEPPPPYEEQLKQNTIHSLPPCEYTSILINFRQMIRTETKIDEIVWNKVEKWANEEKADWRSCFLLAQWYNIAEKNIILACEFYEKASDQNHVYSQFMSGHLHYLKIKPRNIHRAVYWFTRAIQTDENCADAWFALGCIRSEGYKIQNYEEYNLYDFVKKAAKEGHGPAQHRLRAAGVTDAIYFPAVNKRHILIEKS